MKTCQYCDHRAGYVWCEDDYGQVDICACCYGDPCDPAECTPVTITSTQLDDDGQSVTVKTRSWWTPPRALTDSRN